LFRLGSGVLESVMTKPQVTGHGIELPVNPAWEVHPSEVKAWLDKKEDVVLLDCRQPREWNYAHLEGAILAPLNELEEKAQSELASLKKSRVIVYCHVGGRSLRGTALLRHCGFENVHSMAGGIEAWSLIVDPSIPRY
jgi:rhodanese-related sulfurtransferase